MDEFCCNTVLPALDGRPVRCHMSTRQSIKADSPQAITSPIIVRLGSVFLNIVNTGRESDTPIKPTGDLDEETEHQMIGFFREMNRSAESPS
jgi:hypothetical protein